MTTPPAWEERGPLLVAARRVLLDATDALQPHLSALVLVGAQALYLRTEDAGADLAVASYTKDADLVLSLTALPDEPHLESALEAAGFALSTTTSGHREPGVWVRTTQVGGGSYDVPVDLLVPSGQLNSTRRSAAPPPHDRMAARRIDGLDAALVDFSPVQLTALEDSDTRVRELNVAGPAALLVSKAHKIGDRLQDLDMRGKDRLNGGKDAADVFRIMRSHDPVEVGERLRVLAQDEIAGSVTSAALPILRKYFGAQRTRGTDLAVVGLQYVLPEQDVRQLCSVWTAEALLAAGVP